MERQVCASIAVGAGGDHDLFNQRHDQIARGGCHCFIAVDQIAQGLRAVAVVFDHAGMHDRVIERRHVHAGAQVGAFGRHGFRTGAQAFHGDAGDDRIGKALVLAVEFGQAPFGGRALCDGCAAMFRQRQTQFLEIGSDHVGVQHVVGDSVPKPRHGLLIRYRRHVAAHAGAFRVGASPAIGTDDRILSAAFPARHQAGQQPLGPPRHGAWPGTVERQPFLHPVPEVFVDDAHIRHFACHKLRLTIHPGYPFAGVRVFPEGLTVVEDAPAIEFVVEDAVAALPAAGKGTLVPQAAAWPGHAFAVQAGDDGRGAGAIGVLPENAADDFCLLFVHRAQAVFEFPIAIDVAHDAVAIGQTAGDAAGLDTADLPALGLFRELFDVKRRYRAAHPHVQRADFAFGQCDDARADKAGALVDRGHVFLIA